jgi:predicted nucleic acid-binding protein
MAGAAFPSSRLEQFERAIEQGALVIMADVAARDVDAAEEAVRRIDPEVEITGVEPTAPIIP